MTGGTAAARTSAPRGVAADRAVAADPGAAFALFGGAPLRPSALLCDMDGTLIDSEPLWSAAARHLAESHRAPWTDADDHRIVGWSVPAVADLLITRGVPLDDASIAASLHDGVACAMAAGVPWRTGAVELLTAARDAGMPCALVTMSYRHLVEVVVRAAPAGAFTTVVAGDDVAHPKPAPDAYLLAAWALDVAAADCVALEDSPTGVASALAAGALTFAVDPDQHVGEHPRLTRSTLADVGVALGLIR